MISIKGKCEGKVWKALQFMVDGLEKQSNREDFRVDMSTFGDHIESICYGCAATCAIQEACGVNFTIKNIFHPDNRAKKIKAKYWDLFEFERAINEARQGCMSQLFVIMNKVDSYKPSYSKRFFLTTGSWREEIPKVEDLIKKLKKKDI